jgi:hypothetical protein
LNKEDCIIAFTVKNTDNSKLVVVKALTLDVSGHCRTIGESQCTSHVGLKAILPVTTAVMTQNKFS